MCYAKPGPRCSAYAAKKLLEASRACLTWYETYDQSDDKWSEGMKLIAKRDAARKEYNLTSAGIKELEHYVLRNPDDTQAALQLQAAKMERASRIEAAGGKQRNHAVRKNQSYDYATNLSKPGETLKRLSLEDPKVQTMVDESNEWVAKLSSDQISSMRWYSQDGYDIVNGWLSNPEKYANQAAVAAEVVEHMDEAFKYVNTNKSVVSYRRHFFYNENGTFAHPTAEQMREYLPVGGIYRPGFYMSTSLDPDNAPPSDGSVAFLEIKSKRAASLSAVASQGVGEREFLLPRDGEYRVISNTNRITVEDSSGKQRTLNVIQLEEL